MELPIPRINGKLLGRYMNRVVFIVIDATSLRRDQYGRMVAKTTDGIDVTVSLPAGEVFESSYVHIEGKVNPNNLIEVISLQPMNNNFDVGNYNAAVDLMTGKFSYLFA
eukprot:gene4983-5343_t